MTSYNEHYGDSLMSMPTFHSWYNTFRDSRESVVDEQWEGWPSRAHNKVLWNAAVVIIQEDQRITVNSHNIWTFWLAVHSLFCTMIYRCRVCRAGGDHVCLHQNKWHITLLNATNYTHCNLWILPEIKKALCGVRFESNQHVKSWVKMDYHLSSKGGRNGGPSVFHWRGVILKRTMRI